MTLTVLTTAIKQVVLFFAGQQTCYFMPGQQTPGLQTPGIGINVKTLSLAVLTPNNPWTFCHQRVSSCHTNRLTVGGLRRTCFHHCTWYMWSRKSCWHGKWASKRKLSSNIVMCWTSKCNVQCDEKQMSCLQWIHHHRHQLPLYLRQCLI